MSLGEVFGIDKFVQPIKDLKPIMSNLMIVLKDLQKNVQAQTKATELQTQVLQKLLTKLEK